MGTHLKGERGGGAQREGSRSEKATSQKARGRFWRTERGDTPPPALNAVTATENVAVKCPLRRNGVCSRPLACPPSERVSCADSFGRRFLRRLFSKPFPPPPPSHKAAGIVTAESHRKGTATYNACERWPFLFQHAGEQQHYPLPLKSPSPVFLESRSFL